MSFPESKYQTPPFQSKKGEDSGNAVDSNVYQDSDIQGGEMHPVSGSVSQMYRKEKIKNLENLSGISVETEAIKGATAGFYSLRSEPFKEAFKFGTLLGNTVDVKVIGKANSDDISWYKIQFADKEYLKKITGKDKLNTDDTNAIQMFNAGMAWVTSDAITAIVSYEQFLSQLREFEKVHSNLSVLDRITKLRQMSHSNELPFDQIIGSQKGNYYENQRPNITSFYQLLKDAKAFQLPNGEIIDIYHFIVGLEALQPEKRMEKRSAKIPIPMVNSPYIPPNPFSIPVSDKAKIEGKNLVIEDIGASYNASTWSGDIGAGVANLSQEEHEEYEKDFKKKKEKAEKEGKPYDIENERFNHYFEAMAPEADLLADIDAWGAYDMVSSNGISSVEEIIKNYYGNISVDDKVPKRKKAISNFLIHNNFSSAENLSSQNNQVNFIANQIEKFAYVWIWQVEPTEFLSDTEEQLIKANSKLMAIKFLDWLEILAKDYDVKIENTSSYSPLNRQYCIPP